MVRRKEKAHARAYPRVWRPLSYREHGRLFFWRPMGDADKIIRQMSSRKGHTLPPLSLKLIEGDREVPPRFCATTDDVNDQLEVRISNSQRDRLKAKNSLRTAALVSVILPRQ